MMTLDKYLVLLVLAFVIRVHSQDAFHNVDRFSKVCPPVNVTEDCYCVESDTGVKVLGTDTPQNETLDCINLKTKCPQHTKRNPFFKCDHNGLYARKACLKNGKFCYCVSQLDGKTTLSRRAYAKLYDIDCDTVPANITHRGCFIPPFVNGYITGLNDKGRAPLDAKIEFTCNEGYEIIGPPKRICRRNGILSRRELPQCGPPLYDVV